jgi:hypothetical protein
LIEKSIKIIGNNLSTIKSPINNQKSRWKFVFDRQFRSIIDPKKLNTATLTQNTFENTKYIFMLKNTIIEFKYIAIGI